MKVSDIFLTPGHRPISPGELASLAGLSKGLGTGGSDNRTKKNNANHPPTFGIGRSMNWIDQDRLNANYFFGTIGPDRLSAGMKVLQNTPSPVAPQGSLQTYHKMKVNNNHRLTNIKGHFSIQDKLSRDPSGLKTIGGVDNLVHPDSLAGDKNVTEIAKHARQKADQERQAGHAAYIQAYALPMTRNDAIDWTQHGQPRVTHEQAMISFITKGKITGARLPSKFGQATYNF